MNCYFKKHCRLGAAFVAALLCMAPQALAQNGQPITRVEEDWEIDFGVPAVDPDLIAPEIDMIIAPNTNLDGGDYAVFEVNHQTQPNPVDGGLQLQHWSSGSPVAWHTSRNQSVVQIANDVATFTLSVQVQNGTLTFGVSNGNSQTWGTFGTNGRFSVSSGTNLADLSGYDPNTSLTRSYVGFAYNRVQRVIRNQVRYYSNGVLQSTNSTAQVMYQYTGN